jgi:16S rRNA (cytidine1402-2'-O)-methyltransferase
VADIPANDTPTAGATGCLYVVATPLGNLQDLSPRAAQVLHDVDLVAAEDTRRAQTLLSHLGLRKPVESCHEHTERGKSQRLVARLLAGQCVAYVSDAGVPGLSDPGALLVAAAWEAGVRVVPIPGPSAVATALSVCGFNADRFLFAGYPPRKRGERQAFYAELAAQTVPTVIYEAPHRIRESLGDAQQAFGPQRLAVIGREMTKQFEEFLRGPLSELRAHFETHEPLGEFTVVFAGAEADQPSSAPTDVARVTELLAATDLTTSKAAEVLCALGVARNDAYDAILKLRRG